MTGVAPLFAAVLLLLSLGVVFAVAALKLLRFLCTSLPSMVNGTLTLPPVRRFLSSRPKTLAFLGARFSPDGSPGLHATLGLLALLFFALILVMVGNEIGDPRLASIDSALLHTASGLRTPLLTDVFAFITLLGNRSLVAPFSLVVVLALLLLGKQRRMLIAGCVGAVIGEDMFNRFLKAAYMRPRPVDGHALEAAGGWSFPSGHAMISIVFWGVLVYFLLILVRSTAIRVTGITIAFVLVLLVGTSRVYLGVHYPSDVIAGYVAGLFWLTFCVTFLETMRKRRSGQRANDRRS